MSVPNSIRYGNGSSAGTCLPAPADKAQADSYMQNAQNVGTVQTEKSKHVVVRDYVYLTLWKNVKFITNEMVLDFEGLIAKTVMREVNVADVDSIQKDFWARNHSKD
jgi:hypothetical protein